MEGVYDKKFLQQKITTKKRWQNGKDLQLVFTGFAVGTLSPADMPDFGCEANLKMLQYACRTAISQKLFVKTEFLLKFQDLLAHLELEK